MRKVLELNEKTKSYPFGRDSAVSTQSPLSVILDLW